ncbi:aspartate kinase, monofunctional class [Halobacteroides halobius DSM 5150]|uniref:Aspartokinase n=1 Tax=Halobacteroides halobius (strain ATCC 35273 / DSM 5150 / MD-1) TaxID=748449 RepID=L0K8B1_HALHC|nr:aspartate kinase [Halobacteroides halobius]AGB41522.1 aspartate kinase, monofunctional class [Halobacteroides halobius DSM 5150]
MGLVVQKYGGSSVADVKRIKRVAERIVKRKRAGNQVVSVVSAMGDQTDELIGLSQQITDTPPKREYDMLVATGEQVSVALLAMAINELGEEVVSLTGSQVGIITDNLHSKAQILEIESERLEKELSQDKIVIVAGFQGVTVNNDITTLGRGGSDTTAVAVATALKADVCEIYTDVDGVYTTDPRVVKEARKLPEVSYEEMLELASLGADVLHPRSVEIAKQYDVKLAVKSSFYCSPGTYIKEVAKLEKTNVVSGVTCNQDEVKISIVGVPDEPGIASKVFKKLAEQGINVDMIIQNLHYDDLNDITFTIEDDDLNQAKTILEKLKQELSYKELITDSDVAKVSIVGAGMVTNSGVAAKMFDALGSEEINIEMISTSEIKISCLLDKSEADEAVQVIHDSFNLSNLSGQDA